MRQPRNLNIWPVSIYDFDSPFEMQPKYMEDMQAFLKNIKEIEAKNQMLELW